MKTIKKFEFYSDHEAVLFLKLCDFMKRKVLSYKSVKEIKIFGKVLRSAKHVITVFCNNQEVYNLGFNSGKNQSIVLKNTVRKIN